MREMNVKNKSNPYVHAHILFSDKCLPFIQECYDYCLRHGHSIEANWDETVLNVMLWKYQVSNWYLPMCDPYYSFITEYLKEQHTVYNEGKMVEVQYHLFHGCKDPNKALQILKTLKNNVGKPVYASSIKSHSS